MIALVIPADWRGGWSQKYPEATRVSAIRDCFGEVDGNHEWQKPDDASGRFLHNDASDALSRKDILYLIGRRGTGKTTLLKHLEWRTNKGEVPWARWCVMLPTQRLITQLATDIKTATTDPLSGHDLAEAVKCAWRWVMLVAASSRFIELRGTSLADSWDALVVTAFLEGQAGRPVGSDNDFLFDALKHRMGLLRRLLRDKDVPLHVAVDDVFREPELPEARKALNNLTGNDPGLLLFDTGEFYALADPAAMALVHALTAEVYANFAEPQLTGIHAKLALPSELTPYLTIDNRGKMDTRSAVIEWSTRQLLELIVRRVRESGLAVTDDITQGPQATRAAWLRSLERVMPSQVRSLSGFLCAGDAYLVRHTHKTPRQVIQLLNGIYSLAEQENATETLGTSPGASFSKFLHQALPWIVDDALDMHRSVIPQVEAFVRLALGGQRNLFASTDLAQLLRTSAPVRRRFGITSMEATRLLLHMGVIGVVQGAGELSTVAGQRTWALRVAFEYQIKETLDLNPNTWCAVHPLFYQLLQSQVDQNTFIYPIESEFEGDWLASHRHAP